MQPVISLPSLPVFRGGCAACQQPLGDKLYYFTLFSGLCNWQLAGVEGSEGMGLSEGRERGDRARRRTKNSQKWKGKGMGEHEADLVPRGGGLAL